MAPRRGGRARGRMQMEGEKWYSPNAIAEMMDIDYETARKLVYRLPHVDVGGGSKRACPRVRPEIFNAWLMQQDGYNPGIRNLRAIRGGKK